MILLDLWGLSWRALPSPNRTLLERVGRRAPTLIKPAFTGSFLPAGNN